MMEVMDAVIVALGVRMWVAKVDMISLGRTDGRKYMASGF